MARSRHLLRAGRPGPRERGPAWWFVRIYLAAFILGAFVFGFLGIPGRVSLTVMSVALVPFGIVFYWTAKDRNNL
jgi:hypothetical protein